MFLKHVTRMYIFLILMLIVNGKPFKCGDYLKCESAYQGCDEVARDCFHCEKYCSDHGARACEKECPEYYNTTFLTTKVPSTEVPTTHEDDVVTDLRNETAVLRKETPVVNLSVLYTCAIIVLLFIVIILIIKLMIWNRPKEPREPDGGTIELPPPPPHRTYSHQIATADTDNDGNVFEPISNDPSTRSLQQSDSSEEVSTESNESACAGARPTAIVQPTRIQQMNEKHKFVRFRLREREGMISADHLPLYIWYEPNTLMTPAGDVVVGVSDNPADFPNLHPGQRRISPVLVCLPHGASFSRPITVLCHRISSTSPEPTTSSISSSPPEQDTIVKVLHSSTQLGDQTEWRTADDALCILLQDGGISLSINHFCLYCVVEEEMSALCEIGQRTVSIFIREKSVHQGEVFVKVTVMLSDSKEEAKTPFTGDKLVEQIPLAVVNKRPITLTLTLPDTGTWTEHSNTTEQVFHEKFMSSGPRYHADQNSFLLCSSGTNHLDFELTLKQCKGLERRITVCEKLDTVLPTPAVASPVGRPFDVNSEPESETVSSQWSVANGRCASERDENASQIASSQFTTRNGTDVSGSYGCGISTNGNGIPLNGESTNALSNNSNCTNGGNARRLVDSSAGDDDGLELSCHGSSGAVGREHHCTNGGHGRVSTGAEGRGLDRVSTGAEGRGHDRVSTGAEGRGHDRVSTGAEGRGLDRVSTGAEGREYDSSEEAASALVPNAPWPRWRSKMYASEEWPLSYDVMEVIARGLDTEDGWMSLARLLKQDTLIPTIESSARMQSSSPTMMLLRMWMLSTHIRREQALSQLVSALRSMQEPCVEDIADFIDGFHRLLINA